MIKLSQRDYRWANEKIGDTNSTIGKLGCLITSLAMFSGEMPNQVESRLKFNENAELIWKSIDDAKLPFTFDMRHYTSSGIDNYTNQYIVVEVEGRHWLSYLGNGKANDPWLGDECEVLQRYKSITGYAVLTPKIVIPPWAQKEWEWALSKGLITKESKPTEEFVRTVVLIYRYDNHTNNQKG